MEKTGMLVRMQPVKLALETAGRWDEQSSVDASKESACLHACVSVCLVSIYQSIHNVCVCVSLSRLAGSSS